MEKQITIGNKAIIAHACLMFLGVGFFTIWFPLAAKLTAKMNYNEKRIHGEVGVLKKEQMDSPTSKITSVKITQGILGRVFGYGTLSINVSGDSHDYVFGYVDNPRRVKDELLKMVDR